MPSKMARFPFSFRECSVCTICRESLEPSRPHPHGLPTESQASTRRSPEPFVLTTPCRNLKGGKRVGLTCSRVWPRPHGAWRRASCSAGPSTPAQQGRFRVSVRWRPPEAGERGIQAQIVSRYSLYWARLIWGVRSFIKLALPLSLYSSTCLR